MQIVDARPAGMHSQGAIPGAINVPMSELLNEKNMPKSKEEICAAFKNAGVDIEKPIVFSCGAGVMAVPGFIFTQCMGKQSRVYDGSFSEYKARTQ